MVRGLGNADAARILAARAERTFSFVDDLWRRAGVPSASLIQLADANAFRSSLQLARREALWAIKALRDEPLPLFAAAISRESAPVPKIHEPTVSLWPMTAGGEVIEDYGHVGLTLRTHPLSFLRKELRARRIATCAEAMAARGGLWLEAGGLVLVRQRPGSAPKASCSLRLRAKPASQIWWLAQGVREISSDCLLGRHDRRLRPRPTRWRLANARIADRARSRSAGRS